MGRAECEMNHTQLSSSESEGEKCHSTLATSSHQTKGITESQSAAGWEGSLEAIWSNTPIQAGPPGSSCLGPHPNGFGIPPRMETPQLLWAEVCGHRDSVKGFCYIMNIGNISLRHFFFRSQLSQLTIVCQTIHTIIVGLCWIALACLYLGEPSTEWTLHSRFGFSSAEGRVISLNLLASPNAAKDTAVLLDLPAVSK